jgi:hypothetical protein
MVPSTLYLPEAVSRDDGLAAHRTATWLSLGATPTFGFMAVLTGIFGGGEHGMLCTAATPASPLSGMLPMYLLVGGFHCAPWLKLISRWRSGGTPG